MLYAERNEYTHPQTGYTRMRVGFNLTTIKPRITRLLLILLQTVIEKGIKLTHLLPYGFYNR